MPRHGQRIAPSCGTPPNAPRTSRRAAECDRSGAAARAQRCAANRRRVRIAAGLVDRYGVAVDFAIHAPNRHSDERNYHAHVLMTTRQMVPTGLAPKPERLTVSDGTTRDRSAGNELAIGHSNKPDRRAHRLATYTNPAISREASISGPGRFGHGADAEGSDLATATGRPRRAMPSASGITATRRAVLAEIIDLAAERERRAQEDELRRAVRWAASAADRGADRAALDVVISKPRAREGRSPQQRAALSNRTLALPEVVGTEETETARIALPQRRSCSPVRPR